MKPHDTPLRAIIRFRVTVRRFAAKLSQEPSCARFHGGRRTNIVPREDTGAAVQLSSVPLHWELQPTLASANVPSRDGALPRGRAQLTALRGISRVSLPGRTSRWCVVQTLNAVACICADHGRWRALRVQGHSRCLTFLRDGLSSASCRLLGKCSCDGICLAAGLDAGHGALTERRVSSESAGLAGWDIGVSLAICGVRRDCLRADSFLSGVETQLALRDKVRFSIDSSRRNRSRTEMR